MSWYVHYHKTTGAIASWGSAPTEESHFADHAIAILPVDTLVDPAQQRIDPATETLISKTDEEIRRERQPKDFEVENAIAAELAATDQYAMPDRPMTDERREAWRAYRQILRDLSKGLSHADQVRYWPLRPDGLDAIASLRARL